MWKVNPNENWLELGTGMGRFHSQIELWSFESIHNYYNNSLNTVFCWKKSHTCHIKDYSKSIMCSVGYGMSISNTRYISTMSMTRALGHVSLRLMTSQFKDIITHAQKYKAVKCIFCRVWVQNFVWNFKGVLWNFTQNFEPTHHKICILRGGKNLTTYDISELWHLKSLWDGPLVWWKRR